ncbi:Beta-glucanase [Fusarium oxysporum f. sp. albedinis]|nr:Beta-glucanase [Fusarium oxysporum f. sp. albedinis]
MKQTMIAPILIQGCIKDLEELGDIYVSSARAPSPTPLADFYCNLVAILRSGLFFLLWRKICMEFYRVVYIKSSRAMSC